MQKKVSAEKEFQAYLICQFLCMDKAVYSTPQNGGNGETIWEALSLRPVSIYASIVLITNQLPFSVWNDLINVSNIQLPVRIHTLLSDKMRILYSKSYMVCV